MPKTLLLADDSVVIQKLVALSFANEDVNLVTVYNGDEAIEKARECRPDAVLADVVMPGKNGYEVCEAIRQDPQLAHVPVLLLTGTFEAFDEDRASQAGSNGHITKPFEAQALVDRVNDLLASAPGPAAAAVSEAASPASSEATDEAYDFFDEEMPAAEVEVEAPSAIAETPADDVFAFGREDAPDLEPLSAEDAEDLDLDLGGDRTVAMMGDAPSLDTGSDPLVGMSDSNDDAGAMTVTASGLADPAEDSADVSFGSRVTSPEVDPAATVLADEAFGSAEPVAPADSGLGLTADPEDFFASAPGASLSAPEEDPDLEFSFDAGTAPSAGVPAELDLSSDANLAPPLPEADLDPAGSSAYDVSISDLGDSFSLDVSSPGGATAPQLPITPAAAPPQLPITPAAAPPQVPITPAAAPPQFADPAPQVPITTPAAPAPQAPTAPVVAPAPPAPVGQPSVADELTGAPSFAPMEAQTQQPLAAEIETPAPAVAVAEPATALPRPEESANDHAWPVEESLAPEVPVSEVDPFGDSFSAGTSPSLETDFGNSSGSFETGLGSSSSDLDPVLAAPAFSSAADPQDGEGFAPALEARPIPATAAGAHLSDVMRDRVHETLEKVAWEAFADLSDTIVRQVLERVEQVAWEVIPQMAETLIQDEIRKIKGDDEG